MNHVALFGGTEIEPILRLLEERVGVDTAWWIGTLAAIDVDGLDYQTTGEPLAALAPRLARGELASIQMQRIAPAGLLAGLYAPRFGGEPCNQWRCVVEGPEADVAALYASCRAMDGIAFVSHSVDEAPELTAAAVSADTFPWDDWRLVRAAVRTPDGPWEERIRRS